MEPRLNVYPGNRRSLSIPTVLGTNYVPLGPHLTSPFKNRVQTATIVTTTESSTEAATTTTSSIMTSSVSTSVSSTEPSTSTVVTTTEAVTSSDTTSATTSYEPTTTTATTTASETPTSSTDYASTTLEPTTKLTCTFFWFACKHVVTNCVIFFEILDLERFRTAEVTFKVTQGHWYWRHSTCHLWLPINLSL